MCTHYIRQPIRLAGRSEISKSGYGAIFRCAQKSLKNLFSVVVVAIFFCFVSGYAQGPQLPAVNLGNTTFLDGVAEPGWVVEEIGAGVHDNRAADFTGQIASTSPDTSSVTALTHIAWISHARTLGGWPGAESLFSGVWVNAGPVGSTSGFGDVTLGPILQWSERKLFGAPIYQRAALDFDIPLGTYSPKASLNIGSGHWDVQPAYTITVMPEKRIETSWRLFYLWNAPNNSPPIGDHASREQAGQAVHLNGTLAFEALKGLYVGANGYYLRQVSTSRIDTRAFPGRQEISGIGPGMVMQRGKWFYFANLYHEAGVRDMSEGDKIVLRVMRVF